MTGSQSSSALGTALAVAVPTAALAASSYALYANRSQVYAWAVDLMSNAKRTAPAPGKAYLSGNYGPVDDELLVQDLAIEGKLPAGLEGVYVRTGPNPAFKPTGGYHWFDGDGMLHAVRIKGGRASYSNRYVETDRLRQERAAGRALFPKLGDMYGLRGVALAQLFRVAKALGIVSTDKGAGTANTALAFHGGRLLALNEGDLPYAVSVSEAGALETLGRVALDAQGWQGNFTAHPKIDPVNGEMVAIGYRFAPKPYVTAGVLDKEGRLLRQWGVDVPYPVMMHDMAATEHYVVLMHLPLVIDPELMVKANTLPFAFKRSLPGRFGLLRRDAPSSEAAEVQWFELPGPGFAAIHAANAWEDAKGDVKLYLCQQDDLTLDLDAMNCDQELAHLTEYTLSPSTGAATSRRLSDAVGDFPVVHPGKVTRPTKFAYLATMDRAASTPTFTGIAKFDLAPAPKSPAAKDAKVGSIAYPAGVYGGEAVFVPRSSTITDPKAAAKAAKLDEDDGWLLVYVYDSNKDASYLHVYDARAMAAKPLAAVRLPRRVPYGFHGTWVPEAALRKQVPLA